MFEIPPRWAGLFWKSDLDWIHVERPERKTEMLFFTTLIVAAVAFYAWALPDSGIASAIRKIYR